MRQKVICLVMSATAFSTLLPAGLLIPGRMVAAQTPVVFKVSEGVRPNAVLSLYGEYLTGSPQVRFLRDDGSVAATQPAVQKDPAGHFCRVIFPSLAAGAYRLAVKNPVGWSTRPFFVNRAEPRWISEERAYSGLPLKLIGRNLDAWEYGGKQGTRVRLVSATSGKAVVVQPDAVTPYCVDFTTPARLAPGNYYVEVSAGSAQYGRDWQRLNNHSEYPDTIRDTVIRVEQAPDHPGALALRVAWANDFNWNRVVNAKARFGARGDGATDDTHAIQNALDHVGTSGGGVVFLPNGTYKVSALTLGSRSILQGESRDGTVVLVSKSHSHAITLAGRAQGISTMTLRYQPGVPAQDDGHLVGGNAEETFLFDTTFDLLRQPDVSVKQGPYYFEKAGPLLVAQCRFYISSMNLWDHAVRSRVTFRNNYVDMHDGLGLSMSSEKLLVLDNELVFHPAPYAGWMNGFFLNEGWMGWNIYNAYIAGNNVHDLNGPGDCQPFAADSAWSCFAGAVVASSASTVDVRNDVSADFQGLESHETELIIVQGRGLGQFRRAVSHQDLGGRPTVVRLTVNAPWDIPPDASSVVSVGSWHTNNVFSNNTVRSAKSPYNMYFGGSYDCIDADAVSENTEGWINWGRIGEYPKASWHCPVYFSQLKRSRFSGKSSTYATMGITIRTENETTTYRGIADYGTEIRDNLIDRAVCSNEKQRLAGTAAIATFTQNWMTTATADSPLILATLCEGNTIRNSSVGFDLNKSHAFAIRGTIFENCFKPVNDSGFDTVLLPGAPDTLKPPRAVRNLNRSVDHDAGKPVMIRHRIRLLSVPRL